MSRLRWTVGSAKNSAELRRIGCSTNPQILKSQVAASNRGTVPACSTGHFSVRYCPGGSRSRTSWRVVRSLIQRSSTQSSWHGEQADDWDRSSSWYTTNGAPRRASVCRNGQPHDRPPPIATRSDSPAVGTGDFLDDRQPDACSSRLPRARLLAAIESLENERQIVWGDSLPGVGDGHPHCTIGRRDLHHYIAPGRRVLGGVIQKVPEGLRKQVGIGPHRSGHSRGDADNDPLSVKLRAANGQHPAYQLAQIHKLQIH